MSKCKICNIELIIPDTYTNALKRQKYLRCRSCISKERKQYYLENQSQIRHKMLQRKIATPKNQILTRCKNRAKEYGIDFNLELDDIILPTQCPVFHTPLTYGAKHPENRYSIDRIDSSRGYVKGNIQIISQLANTMKSNATKEQLDLFAKWILNRG